MLDILYRGSRGQRKKKEEEATVALNWEDQGTHADPEKKGEKNLRMMMESRRTKKKRIAEEGTRKKVCPKEKSPIVSWLCMQRRGKKLAISFAAKKEELFLSLSSERTWVKGGRREKRITRIWMKQFFLLLLFCLLLDPWIEINPIKTMPLFLLLFHLDLVLCFKDPRFFGFFFATTEGGEKICLEARTKEEKGASLDLVVSFHLPEEEQEA